MNDLASLLAPGAVRLDSPATTWQDAIGEAGELLAESGATTSAYTTRMIEAVNEHGPYIVIAPGFALAHARPGADVHRTGASLIRLTHPVEFGHENNDPVTIVMALAATDATAHQSALAQLATILANPSTREQLDTAQTETQLREILSGDGARQASAANTTQADAPGHSNSPDSTNAPEPTTTSPDLSEELAHAPASKGHILCVCGNGVGTSLFLKNTLEQVLDTWGWGPYITVEATDTISAKGKAGGSDVVFTSRAIADALGQLDVPVEIITDFTSREQIDSALRRRYVV